MTKDDRTTICETVGAFVPNLVEDLDPVKAHDDRVMAILGEALAQMDAEIIDLKANIARLAELGAADPLPQGVSPEEIGALLRYHRVNFADVFDEVYVDDNQLQRVRPKVVYRPAMPEDVLAHREEDDMVIVVLRDGRRYLLRYPNTEID